MIPYAAFKRDKVFNKKDEPLRVYGTLGDGELQKRVTNAIIDWCLPADVRDFNFDLLDGETHSISDVLSRAANVPFLAERRVVHVMRAEALDNLNRSGESKDKSKIFTCQTLERWLKKFAGQHSFDFIAHARSVRSQCAQKRKSLHQCRSR